MRPLITTCFLNCGNSAWSELRMLLRGRFNRPNGQVLLSLISPAVTSLTCATNFFPWSATLQGISNLPWMRGEHRHFPVISHSISPPWLRKCQSKWLNSLGKWPTVVLLLSTLRITTATVNLSSWFPFGEMWFRDCSCMRRTQYTICNNSAVWTEICNKWATCYSALPILAKTNHKVDKTDYTFTCIANDRPGCSSWYGFLIAFVVLAWCILILQVNTNSEPPIHWKWKWNPSCVCYGCCWKSQLPPKLSKDKRDEPVSCFTISTIVN